MKYMNLDQKGAVLAEYVWIDGSNGLRSKTKVSHVHMGFRFPHLGFFSDVGDRWAAPDPDALFPWRSVVIGSSMISYATEAAFRFRFIRTQVRHRSTEPR